MRKYLLPENGQFYKANLHCHTTISDGAKTPQEIKQMYLKNGYSVVAYTDHDIFAHHDYLSDSSFLALHGVEIQIDEKTSNDKPGSQCKTCHLCFIATDQNTAKHPWKYRSAFYNQATSELDGDTSFDENEYSHQRIYSHESINEIIKTARDNGFFVTYNHPTWSLQDSSDFMYYENLCAMEITNYNCIVAGYFDYNPRVYDEMLRANKKLYCIAADDNHNRSNDSFGGFTVIKADKLEYKSISDALQNGNFYASQGPIINALWYEDGHVHIECENAKEIYYSTARTMGYAKRCVDENSITCADFPVDPFDIYFRITVIDFDNNIANTNAYFVNDIQKSEA